MGEGSRVQRRGSKRAALERHPSHSVSDPASGPSSGKFEVPTSPEAVLQRRHLDFSIGEVTGSTLISNAPRSVPTKIQAKSAWGTLAPAVVPATVQRMKVRGNDTPSTLSSATLKKHVEPAETQETKATAEYGSRTFVTDASVITDVVDAHDHDFTEENGVRSGRFDFTASVKISQYMKNDERKGMGEPVVQTVNNESRDCEIGVVKTGEDVIQVVHFQLAGVG